MYTVGNMDGKGRRRKWRVYAALPAAEAAATFAVAAWWWGWFVWRWHDLSYRGFSNSQHRPL